MRVAVHRQGSFVPRWLEAASSLGHTPVPVDAFSSDLMSQLATCGAFLWQFSQDEANDLAHARHILLGAEAMGLRVFPNHATNWHFDDKVAQKYLLEAIGAPLAQTWVFYSLREALAFLDKAEYPLVFKLAHGAGSVNVHMARDRASAVRLTERMFGRGVSTFARGERLRRAHARWGRSGYSLRYLRVRLERVVQRQLQAARNSQRERGYVLFQHYVPANDHDVRITVIGGRRFCFLRKVRDNDFRASGSGRILYLDAASIPNDMVEIATSISDRLGFQSMAYDFVREGHTGKAVLLEMSYTFNAEAVLGCAGFLDRAGRWQAESVWPQDAILSDLLS